LTGGVEDGGARTGADQTHAWPHRDELGVATGRHRDGVAGARRVDRGLDGGELRRHAQLARVRHRARRRHRPGLDQRAVAVGDRRDERIARRAGQRDRTAVGHQRGLARREPVGQPAGRHQPAGR
jgi:hypothetical protein